MINSPLFHLLLLLCSSSDSLGCEASLSVPLILEQMFPCLCRCVLGEVPDYMECSCYNVLGGSWKVGDTDGYPLVLCIGRQLSYHQQGMTLCLERCALHLIPLL